VGDYVLLYKKKDTLEKLGTIADGPFRIKEIKNRNTVTLDLPSRSKIYSTINLEKIRPFYGEIPTAITLPKNSKTEPRYEVEEVLAEQEINKKPSFLIR